MLIDVYVTVLGTTERNSSVSLEAWIWFSLDIQTLEDEGTVFCPDSGNLVIWHHISEEWHPQDSLLGISYGLAGSTKYMHSLVSIEKLYHGSGS